MVSNPLHLRHIKVGNKKNKLGLNQGIAENKNVSPQIESNQKIIHIIAGNINYLHSVKMG